MFRSIKGHTIFKFSGFSRFCCNVTNITNINVAKDLRNMLGSDQLVISDNNEMLPYTTDWLGAYCGGSLVVFPTNTQDVSNILSYCNLNSLSIVPQGGNTGLVGGGIGRNASNDIILSMKKMNKIIKLDKIKLKSNLKKNATKFIVNNWNTSAIVCESGCILEELEKYANIHGNFSVPLDLGSKGSCMIGGNVATNAGKKRDVYI